MSKSRIFQVVRDILASRHMFWILPVIVGMLFSVGLDLGWMIDDHGHRAALIQHPSVPELHRSPEDLFVFIDGDPQQLDQSVADGSWPWWSTPGLRLAFWRPVAGWSHALDYAVWPESPRFMHAHSIAWLVILVLFLLLLYRRLIPSAAVAGLAALIFAIDDSQTFPALWLANRNALLALVFGVGCLIAHDRWRRDGWKAGAFVSPILLLLAVLSNEGAIAIGGYLVAYVLFLDPAPIKKRWLTLLPTSSIGILWTIAYKLGGYGTLGSGVYIDPASEPGRFLVSLIERAPFLLWGWWGFPPADATTILPDSIKWGFWGFVVLLLGCLTLFLYPILRREPAARFLGLGMILSLVPASSTFPSNRLLGFVGLGAAGLLALLLADLAQPGTKRWRRRAMLSVLVLLHLIVAPLMIRPLVAQMQQLERLVHQTAQSLVEPSDPAQVDATTVVVSTPSVFLSLVSRLVAIQSYAGIPRPTFVLASGLYTMEVSRTDAHTLVIRPEGGFLQAPGNPPPDEQQNLPTLDPRRTHLMLDLLFRDLDRAPFQVGDRLDLQGVQLEVLEAKQGRPYAVAYRFDTSLEAKKWRWLAWEGGHYVDFPLPEIGQTIAWSPLEPPL